MFVYTISPASVSDAEAMLDVYRPYVEHTAISFETAVPSVGEFENRIKRVTELFPWLKAEEDGAVCGYAYASQLKPRGAYAWAVETSVYVRQDKRGQGVGKALYRVLEAILERQGITNLYACITWPNPESVAFHEARGYRYIGRFTACGYKFGAWHDVIWMEKFLCERGTPPPPVIPVTQLDLSDLPE